MRRLGAWVVLLAGILLVLAGTAAVVAFGPDNRLTTGPHGLETKGLAIITAPGALAYSGPTVEVTARTDGSRPIFLGLGHHVDVQDYFADSPYTRVDSIGVPWDASTTVIRGGGWPTEPPGRQDWWLVSDEGSGSATVSFPLPDGPVEMVAMDPELEPGLVIQVSTTLVQPGAFVGGIAVMACGLGLLFASWVLSSRPTT